MNAPDARRVSWRQEPNLEIDAYAKLDHPRQPGRNDLAEAVVHLLSGFIEPRRVVHGLELRVIERVVELGPELQVTLFTAEIELFHQGQVPVVQPGSAEKVFCRAAERALSGPGEGRGVEPAVEGAVAMSQGRRADEIDAHRITTSRDVCIIGRAEIDREWKPAGERRDTGELPSVQNASRKDIRAAGHIREVVQVVNGQHMRLVK